jgi:2,3-dihydroxybiphenyl 1,2-dioxygenase
MQHQIETAYIGLESPQPRIIGDYLQNVVGLMPTTDLPNGESAFRVDNKVFRLNIHQGPRADVSYIGFEAVDAVAFDATVARLRTAGFAVEQASHEQIAARKVVDMVCLRAPWGVSVELVHGLATAETPFHSPGFPEGFVTEGQGFGHFVFLIGNDEVYAESRRFAIEGLGMRLSDTLCMPIGDAEMRVTFLHCNARHHSLALGRLPLPEGASLLHHINFEVRSVRDVGTAFERALRCGTPIANAIGQHTNDQMISFYSHSPDGWQVEIGATGKVVGANWQDVMEYNRISDWGHQPPEVLAELLRTAQN